MPAFGTTLQYGSLGGNAIIFDTFQTINFDQEAVYDETKTDYLYTKITISIKAVLNTGNKPMSTSMSFGRTPADAVANLRKCLLTPCQQLTYKVGNDVLLKSPFGGIAGSGAGPSLSEDARHGPQPKSLNIIQINHETFIVLYTIETYIRECCSGSTLPYLSNRWSETHVIDREMYTTRTIRGRVIFRSDYINSLKFANAQASADSLGRTLVPPNVALPQYFVRQSMEFTQQADGCAFDYAVVDKEEYTVPPPQTTWFEATHKTSSVKGMLFEQQINVRVKSNATTPKASLVSIAAEIATQRIESFGGQLGKTILTRAAAIVYSLHENAVEVTLETYNQAGALTVFGQAKAVNAKNLDYVNGARNQTQFPSPTNRGTANLAVTLFQTYLDGCNAGSTTPVPNPNPGNKTPGKGVINIGTAYSTVKELPNEPPAKINIGTAFYTEWNMDTVYEEKRHVLALPVTGMDPAPASVLEFKTQYPVVGSTTGKKKVRWWAEAWGSPPKIPSQISSDGNLILMDSQVKPFPLVLAPDGETLVYRVEGEYVYGLIDPSKVQYLGGVPPYLGVTTSQSEIQQQQFVTGIIDPPGQPVDLLGD